MSAFALVDVSVYAGALDASCFGNSVTAEAMVDTVDATTFCSGGWRVPVASLRGYTMQLAGPQDLAATAASATLTPDEHYLLTVGTSYPVAIVPQGAAEGAVAYFSEGLLTNYQPVSGAVGDLATHSTTWAITTYPLVRGVFASKTTATATGNGTGHQVGAVSATQYVYAGVHFLTRGGTTSTTVVLESDDNSNFTSATTRATFTAATSRSAQFTRVAGAITDDWWRLRWTISGGSPSVQIRGFIGVQ